MITGLYQPCWLQVVLDSGEQVDAITFVSDRHHSLYISNSSVEDVSPAILQAHGTIGSNADYVYQLEQPSIPGISWTAMFLMCLNLYAPLLRAGMVLTRRGDIRGKFEGIQRCRESLGRNLPAALRI